MGPRAMFGQIARLVVNERRWWIVPILLALGVMALLAFVTEGAAVAPAIYKPY